MERKKVDENYSSNKNVARIAKLPLRAKKGFFERKALLKERLYQKKGFITRKALLKERLFRSARTS